MNLEDYFKTYTAHPVLFVGSGFTFRYTNNALTWVALLEKIMVDLYGNDKKYLDLKYKVTKDGIIDFPLLALEIEKCVEMETANEDLLGINELFYDAVRNNKNCPKMKIYISEIFKQYDINNDKNEEILQFKKCIKNVASIITTNYDSLLSDLTGYNELVGNSILLSNKYGSIYKIHGCIEKANEIVITTEDYIKFDKKYELIRAQLISFFVHNPIIFIGYSVTDPNIQKILTTIFSYIEPNSEEAEKIRNNFLIVEFEKECSSTQIQDHDVIIEGQPIRVKKIKTDNFIEIYSQLEKIILPVSALDIRKVENIVMDIKTQGEIKVQFYEDVDNLSNKDKVIAIGSMTSVQFVHIAANRFIEEYFSILEGNNVSILDQIKYVPIQPNQYFPIMKFKAINLEIDIDNKLEDQQLNKINFFLKTNCDKIEKNYKFTEIKDIYKDENIALTNKIKYVFYGCYNNKFSNEDVIKFLKGYANPRESGFRAVLCAYDYMSGER